MSAPQKQETNAGSHASASTQVSKHDNPVSASGGEQLPCIRFARGMTIEEAKARMMEGLAKMRVVETERQRPATGTESQKPAATDKEQKVASKGDNSDAEEDEVEDAPRPARRMRVKFDSDSGDSDGDDHDDSDDEGSESEAESNGPTAEGQTDGGLEGLKPAKTFRFTFQSNNPPFSGSTKNQADKQDDPESKVGEEEDISGLVPASTFHFRFQTNNPLSPGSTRKRAGESHSLHSQNRAGKNSSPEDRINEM